MISTNPYRHVIIALGNDEYVAIMAHARNIPIAILEKLHTANKGRVDFNSDELEIVGNMLDEFIPASKSPVQQKALKHLRNRIRPGNAAGPKGMGELLQSLAGIDSKSRDELNEIIRNVADRHNNSADIALGGLSPDQVECLIRFGWDNAANPLRLGKSLTFAEVGSSVFFHNIHILLTTLLESKGPNATATGNLNRRLVGELISKMKFDDDYIKQIRNYHTKIDEMDVRKLHVLRVVAECGELIKKQSNRFSVAQAAQDMLGEDKAGEFYRLLFIIFFHKFNMSHCDRLPECPGVQGTFAYILYRLRKTADDWYESNRLMTNIFLPKVQEEIRNSVDVDYEIPWVIEWRVLKPLADFGLLECQIEAEKHRRSIVRIRKTPMFNKFISYAF